MGSFAVLLRSRYRKLHARCVLSVSLSLCLSVSVSLSLSQAKRDCIALAEEVQRLRKEVEKERSGRTKAIAAKKQAERDRDDAVARLVAVQGGRPRVTVEEGAPPEARIPEGDTTALLSKTDSFERAEAEAWGGKHCTHARTHARAHTH